MRKPADTIIPNFPFNTLFSRPCRRTLFPTLNSTTIEQTAANKIVSQESSAIVQNNWKRVGVQPVSRSCGFPPFCAGENFSRTEPRPHRRRLRRPGYQLHRIRGQAHPQAVRAIELSIPGYVDKKSSSASGIPEPQQSPLQDPPLPVRSARLQTRRRERSPLHRRLGVPRPCTNHTGPIRHRRDPVVQPHARLPDTHRRRRPYHPARRRQEEQQRPTRPPPTVVPEATS
jgi:hypothetical protein